MIYSTPASNNLAEFQHAMVHIVSYLLLLSCGYLIGRKMPHGEKSAQLSSAQLT